MPEITRHTRLCCNINGRLKTSTAGETLIECNCSKTWPFDWTTVLVPDRRRIDSLADVSCDGLPDPSSLCPLYHFPLDPMHPRANNQLRSCLVVSPKYSRQLVSSSEVHLCCLALRSKPPTAADCGTCVYLTVIRHVNTLNICGELTLIRRAT